MTCTVVVTNGIIPLPSGLELPDGAEVQLTVPDSVAQPPFADRCAAYIGAADDLPADLPANLDHYVHGHGRAQWVEGKRIILEPLEDSSTAFGALKPKRKFRSITEETEGMEATVGMQIAQSQGECE